MRDYRHHFSVFQKQLYWPNWWQLWPQWDEFEHSINVQDGTVYYFAVVFSFGPFQAEWSETGSDTWEKWKRRYPYPKSKDWRLRDE